MATPHTHHDRAKRSPTGQSPSSRSPGEKCQLGSALHPDRNYSPQGAGCHRDPPISPYLTLDHEPLHLAARPRCPSRSPLTGQAENWGAGGRCMQDMWAGEGSAVREEGSLWSSSTGHPPCIRAGHGAEEAGGCWQPGTGKLCQDWTGSLPHPCLSSASTMLGHE